MFYYGTMFICASKLLRYNPRIPCRPKTKGTRNNLRIFGQNCQRNSSLPVQMDNKNLIRIPAIIAEDSIEDMTPWERLRDSLRDNQTPALKNPPQNYNEIPEAENQDGIILKTNKKTSSTAVQVNLCDFGECRRHIKYGKQLTEEKSGSESDTETSNTVKSICISCKPAWIQGNCKPFKEGAAHATHAKSTPAEKKAKRVPENQKEDDNCNHKSTDIEADKLNPNRIPDVLKQVLIDDEKEKVLTPELHKDGTLEKVEQMSCGSDSRMFNIRWNFIFIGLTLSLVIPSVFIYWRRIITEEPPPPSYLGRFIDYFYCVWEKPKTSSLVTYFF